MMPLLVEAAVRSLILGALVWLALSLVRPRNPHVQKTIWITVLVASIAMPFVLQSQLPPRIEVPDYVGTVVVRGMEGATPPRSASFVASVVTVIYMLGAVVLLARFAIGLAKIARVRRRAASLPSISTREDIRVSEEVLSPATFGSTILLPATVTSWDKPMLTAVLSHERAHVRYRDCYVQWLARLHTCVFWFNPLAWWLQRRLADLAETTSDDAVLASRVDRITYADLLLEIARNPPAGRVVMSAARPGISARIERIISNIPPASQPRRWVRAAVIASLLPAIAIAAATPQFERAAAVAPTNAAQAKADDDAFPEWKSALPTPLKIVDWGDMGNLEAYYPPAAKVAGREGDAVIGLVVNARGFVSETRVLRVAPEGEEWGFGPAAEAASRTLVFENTTGANQKMKIRVKFALDKSRPGGPDAHK